MPRLTPEQRARVDQWITELRSGKYVQTRHTLHQRFHSYNYYCCLGVLCSISPELGEGVLDPDAIVAYKGSKAHLPTEAYSLIGEEEFTTDGETTRENAFIQDLMLSNDRSTSFAIIADMIEAHYKNR